MRPRLNRFFAFHLCLWGFLLSPIYSDTARANSANSVAGADSASANFANTINTIEASNNSRENLPTSDIASLKSLLLSLDLSSQNFKQNSKQNSKKSSPQTPQKHQMPTSYQTPKDYQKHWRALLHYGKRRSSIPKKSPFFLSKKGYKNPQDEYISTINALFDEIESSGKIAESSLDSGAHFDANLDSGAVLDSGVRKSNESIICKYPARMDFIATMLQDIASQSASENAPSDANKTPEKSHENPANPANLAKLFTSLTDNTHCEGLQEFLSIVPIDEITLEFAAESDMYPGSSMGHVYLHLQGIMRDDIQREFEGASFSRKKGDVQEYGMSYYALMSDFFNPLDYARAMVGNLKGHYVLSPYENLKIEYLQNQKRTLYRFALKATPVQKRHFALHLWELRDRQIHYSFITHNCTDGIEEILGVLDSKNFYAPKVLGVSKPFITPAEYLQHLDKQGQIASKEIMLAERKRSFAARFGYNDVLHSRKGSKLSFGYEFPNQIYLNFAPIYSDIKNANNAYKEHIESRLASIELRVAWRGGYGGVDRRGLDSVGLGFGDSRASLDSSVADSGDLDSSVRVFVPKIELMHLFSIADFARTKTLSKLISIRLESNLYEHTSAQNFSSFLNHSTRLFPSIEFGLGFGAYANKLAFFALPSIGYRYEIIHNPYAMLKIGAIAQLGRVRAVVDHSVYYDMIGNNRGYDNKLGVFVGVNVYKQVDIFVDSGAYWSVFDNAKIAYNRAHTWSIKGGISVNF